MRNALLDVDALNTVWNMMASFFKFTYVGNIIYSSVVRSTSSNNWPWPTSTNAMKVWI